jgi:hypothetical protein
MQETMITRQPSLRKFPYPYRSALSICSDIDCCDRARFIEVHRFLNRDLGLPTADSFFGCAMNRPQLGYLEPDGSESADAPFIRDCLKAGLIDTLHTWGDFNGTPPDPVFLRRTALRLADLFNRSGTAVPLWVNHGAPENYQNLRFRLYDSYRGDNPALPWYTADLLPAIGTRFYCSTDMVRWPLDCRPGYAPHRAAARFVGNEIKNAIKRLKGHGRLVRPFRELTRLCNEVTLRDGRRIWGFTRYNHHPRGLWTRATRATLRHSLSEKSLDGLIAAGGYCVVCTHLGLPVETGSLFERADREALEGLAGAFSSGRIWVAPAGVLLSYNSLIRSLSWKTVREGPFCVIELGRTYCPEAGFRPPARRDCAGLTFYTPSPHVTKIRLDGADLAVCANGADETGRTSISVALAPAPDTACLERV